MKQGYEGSSRDSFNACMDDDWILFVLSVKSKLDDCVVSYCDEPFIDLIHDMYLAKDKKNYVGVSISFIHNFCHHILAVRLINNNKTHESRYNAHLIQEKLMDSYMFDFTKHTRAIISDTTNSAKAVSRYFSDEAEQVNCDMHQLNSCLKYGFGMLENVKQVSVLDDNGLPIIGENGKPVKVTKVVTPGGSFPEGQVVLDKVRAIAKYFDHAQRKERLEQLQRHHHLPLGAPPVYGVTRVSSVHNMFSKALYHYYALKKFKDEADEKQCHDTDFVKIFNNITTSEWGLIAEMESVGVFLAKYATSESQMHQSLASWTYYLRKKVNQFINQNAFHILQYTTRPESTTTLKDFQQKRHCKALQDMSKCQHKS
jgi:hypothetical protein